MHSFSTWQRINNLIRDPVTVAAEKRRGVEHLSFCVELYKEQWKPGRYLLHEHPAYATSWQEAVIRQMLSEPGVVTATCDQCFYGCESEAGDPVKKPTTLMTNALELAGELGRRCTRRGEHAADAVAARMLSAAAGLLAWRPSTISSDVEPSW